MVNAKRDQRLIIRAMTISGLTGDEITRHLCNVHPHDAYSWASVFRWMNRSIDAKVDDATIVAGAAGPRRHPSNMMCDLLRSGQPSGPMFRSLPTPPRATDGKEA